MIIKIDKRASVEFLREYRLYLTVNIYLAGFETLMGVFMKGLKVWPSGEVEIIDDVTKSVICDFLGNGYETLHSEDGSTTILLNEFHKVLELDVNPHASLESKIIIDGPVIMHSSSNLSESDSHYSDELFELIKERNTDDAVKKQMASYRRHIETRSRFVTHDSDRWVYNGKAFKAIVLAKGEETSYGAETVHIWLFGGPTNEPFIMRVHEFSLLEVMEMMIEGDLLTADGSPPETLLPAAKQFGLL